MWKFMSLTLPSLPEAHASLPDSVVTPVGSFRLMLLPGQADTFLTSKHGGGTTLQVVPSQRAVKLAVRFGGAGRGPAGQNGSARARCGSVSRTTFCSGEIGRAHV